MAAGFFQRFLSFFKNPDKNLVRFLSFFKQKIACGGLVLFHFSKDTKFGLPGGRFFNEIDIFALENTKKSPAAGCRTRVFIILKQKFACGVLLLFFVFQKVLAFIIFSKSWQISSCSYYFTFNGVLLIPRYLILIHYVIFATLDTPMTRLRHRIDAIVS